MELHILTYLKYCMHPTTHQFPFVHFYREADKSSVLYRSTVSSHSL